jgi:hypothetical protein
MATTQVSKTNQRVLNPINGGLIFRLANSDNPKNARTAKDANISRVTKLKVISARSDCPKYCNPPHKHGHHILIELVQNSLRNFH